MVFGSGRTIKMRDANLRYVLSERICVMPFYLHAVGLYIEDIFVQGRIDIFQINKMGECRKFKHFITGVFLNLNKDFFKF